MPEKLEQSDFFDKLDPAEKPELEAMKQDKPAKTEKLKLQPKRLFDRRKIFGPDYVPGPDEELPREVKSSEDTAEAKSQSRQKRRRQWPDDYDGNKGDLS